MTAQDEILDLVRRLESAPGVLAPLSIEAALHSRLLAAAQNLVASLKKPEIELRNLAKAPVANAILRTAFKINLFGAFDHGATTAQDLANCTAVDHLLMVRIMRTLVSLGIFTQTGPESYAHSSLSEALRNPKIRAVVRGMAETASVMVSLPEYLSSINFDNPADHRPSLFGFARDTDKTMFEWLESEPEQRRIFLEFQSASSEMSDFRLRPLLQSLLTQGDSNAEVAFVDVGGGQGETLREVSNAVQPRGRVILQDLPKVIEDLGTDGGVEVMVYNFLEPQPVKGAAIYFFRHIFHNWPDTVSQQILRNTMSAMGPASRIIIVDEVMPNLHAPLYISYIDISMMAFGGLERTEIHWRQLLETTGLRIGKMEPLDPSSSSSDFIIELSL